jgi:predicted amidophosphoribosyltransferase
VVVVDDVYTTGATAAEVTAVVGPALGLPAHVFTFCRTPLAGNLFSD